MFQLARWPDLFIVCKQIPGVLKIEFLWKPNKLNYPKILSSSYVVLYSTRENTVTVLKLICTALASVGSVLSHHCVIPALLPLLE